MKKLLWICVPVLLLILFTFLGTQDFQNEKTELKNAFIAQFGSDSEIKPEELTIEAYGTYDGCTVTYIYVPREYNILLGCDEGVGGYCFHYPRGEQMMAYKDGVYKSLHEAYAEGWFNDEDVGSIRQIYKWFYPSCVC